MTSPTLLYSSPHSTREEETIFRLSQVAEYLIDL
jgi:hypothetical protein